MPLPAGLLSVSFLNLLFIGLHGLGSQILYLLPLGAAWHSFSETFQLLEVLLDVCTGLSHRGSINHPLILRCLRVEGGVCPELFIQSFIEIGGSLTHFLDYHCNFGHIDGLFGSCLKSM